MADTKFLIVDGPSSFHMGRVNGIGKFNYKKFFEFLTKGVGAAVNIFGKPVYVLPPSQEEKKKKALEYSGFEVQVVDTAGSLDDEYIRERIKQINPEQVSEIILVSSDILDYLSVLETKIKAGIKVIVVATQTIDPKSDNSMLVSNFADLLNDAGIEFVELGGFKESIMLDAWRGDLKKLEDEEVEVAADELPPVIVKAIAPQPVLLSKTINLFLKVGVSDLNSLLDALSEVLKHPGLLKSTLEIK